MNALKNNPSIILLFVLFWLITVNKSQIADIIITDSKLEIFKQSIYYDERNLNITTHSFNNQEYIGKLCYGNDNATVDICIDLYEAYNKNWILLVSDKKYLESLSYFINRDKYARILAVIADNDTILPSTLSMPKFNFPLFWCNAKDFNEIVKYNIFDEEDNYFAKLIYQSESYKIINQFGFYIIVVILLLSVCISVGWVIWMYYLRDYFPDHIQTIQSLLQYFSYLKALVAAINVYNFSLNKKAKTESESTLIQAYVSVIMMALDSIDVSVFWIFLLLISNGWFLYKIEFNHIQAIRLTIGYIVFFSLVVFDKVIDMVINQKIVANFTYSDLKNVILYTVLIVICQQSSLETLKKLKKKYTYAYYYATEFLAPLRIKVSLIKYHCCICIAYWMFTIIHLGVVKSLVEDETIIQVIWANFDLIIFCVLMIVYRPKKFSPFYFTYDPDDEDKTELMRRYGSIYKFNCLQRNINSNEYQYSHYISDDAFDKDDISQIQTSIKHPIVVLLPYESPQKKIAVGYCINPIMSSNRNSSINSNIIV